MRFWHFWDKPKERPAFTQTAVENEPPTINGYTLRVDLEKKTASIIDKQEKGGRTHMVKAKAGFENIFAELNNKKEQLTADKERAKEEALAKVEADFATDEQLIDNLLAQVSEEEPDPEPEKVEVAEESEE